MQNPRKNLEIVSLPGSQNDAGKRTATHDKRNGSGLDHGVMIRLAYLPGNARLRLFPSFCDSRVCQPRPQAPDGTSCADGHGACQGGACQLSP